MIEETCNPIHALLSPSGDGGWPRTPNSAEFVCHPPAALGLPSFRIMNLGRIVILRPS